ncbi:MAG: hypothetical protein EOO29_40860 [Comamonadaceae bacterium]|nr:MAG: hypothetical protein EOO29_40860 [Comamonadaceae bacterium]
MPAKPNYGFEKRQRELEKKRKKAEKAEKRTTSPSSPDQPDGEPGTEQVQDQDKGAATPL